MSKVDRLAALKEARQRGGRLQQWKPEDDGAIYDEVTDEQYRSIVNSRQARDDFIEDDDGSGYVDNGVDEWETNGRGDDDESEESEDEDDFEGEDEELRRARKQKRARAKARAAKAQKKPETAKPKPRSAFSDYARHAPSSSTYRPAPNAMQENEFMASLFSTMSDQSASVSGAADPFRKRKSSPDFPSSDVYEPSSEASYPGPTKRYGEESDEDDEHLFAPKPPRRSSATGVNAAKKPRHADVKPAFSAAAADENADVDMSMAVDTDEVFVKPEPVSDDEMVIKARPLASTNKANGQANQGRRRVVNSTSVKHQPPAAVKAEPELVKPATAAAAHAARTPNGAGKVAPGTAHWSTIQEDLVPQAKTSELDEAKPLGTIKAENVLDEEGTLKMFWLDHMEADGVVHLVGKVLDKASGRYVSACLSINGIKRNLFVKPRATRFQNGRESDDEVTRTDVYQEFDALRSKYGIEEWRAKFVNRKYAFEDQTVTRGESEWMKVVYGFNEAELPVELSGATFSHVFGANTTPFELLVLKRKIMGPCWLEVKGAELSKTAMSWCKIEFTVSEPKTVNPMPDADSTGTPPLTIMSIAIRTIVNHRENKTELLCATTRTWEGCSIDDPTPPERLHSTLNTIIRPIEKFPPGLEARAKTERSPFQTVKAERALLNSLLATIGRYDPDVLVGHNFLGNTFEAMLYRIKELKADQWSRIGRFRRKNMPHVSKVGSNARLLAGRLVADLSSDAAKGMISSTTWSLTEMCATHLKAQREDIDPEDTHTYFDHTLSSPDRLIKYIRLCEVDAYFQMAIASRVQMLPLTKQLTNLAGNSWNLTLNGGRAVRNEFILLHEFHRLKYVCPDKSFRKDKGRAAAAEDGDEEGGAGGATTKTRGKAKYAGGLVFEPKRGLWDTYILVMDFNSLYPSIIQEYNIDFTTVEREAEADEAEEKIPDVPEIGSAQGVLPRIISTLVGRRRQVKALMKDKSASPAKLQQYDIKQQALKLTANSMYGCLGFQGSRFSSRPLAALTTFKGREILTHTKELAESLSLDVVYGDTDSVFVNSNVTTYPEALRIANDFKKLVNERYKLLEIDLDAVFERILLLNKKKYAAVKIEESGERQTEVKGLDMKRREFSKVSKDASAAVLKEILSGEPTEVAVSNIHELLTQLGESIRSGAVPLDDFIIFKRLGKNPEEYPDKKSQPHVQVALRMKAKGVAVRAHDVIPYIMCLGEDGKSARSAQADRAFHPDDLRRQGSELRIDYDLYLDTQILQPILRLCENIEGTDRARLAGCLGLDPARYASHSVTTSEEKQFFTFESQISDKERFKDSETLVLRCPSCEGSFGFEGVLDDTSNIVQPTGIICPSCNAPMRAVSIATQLELAIRAHISRYYLYWTVCDGSSGNGEGCGARTRNMSVYGKRCLGWEREGCKGIVRLEYTDLMLYNQLLYYSHLFDADKALAAVRGTGRAEEVRALVNANHATLAQVAAVAEKYLDRNGRRYVDMKSLFGFMERIKL